MMIAANMAESIRSTMGFPTPTSTQLVGWATGVIAEITGFAKVNNAPGTIVGTCPPGGPLAAGAGSLGSISSMSGPRMASAVQPSAGYPFVSSELTIFCTRIVAHIQTGIVTFTPGQIVGICTNSSLTPGALTAGAGTGGKISGLNGTVLANSIHNAVGYPGVTSQPLIKFCTAIVNYIMTNAVVSYLPGTVTGLCPAGGGALSAGTGLNGTIA